jgi:RNA polymerase sporulation-specific sigma factor
MSDDEDKKDIDGTEERDSTKDCDNVDLKYVYYEEKNIKESDFSNLTDEEIVLIAQEVYGPALGYLYNKYGSMIKAKSRIYFLVGADVDDVEQEAIIGFYKAVRDFRIEHGNTFKSFAEICVRRHMISAIKSATSYKNYPLNYAISIDAQIVDGEKDISLSDIMKGDEIKEPETFYLIKEEQAEIGREIVARLSKFESVVFGYHLEGYTYQEIAIKLGREPKVIDNAIQRIKRKLAVFFASVNDY